MTIEDIKNDERFSGLNLAVELKAASVWYRSHNKVLTPLAFESWLIKALNPPDAIDVEAALRSLAVQPKREVQRWVANDDLRKAEEEKEFLRTCTPEQLSEWRKKHGYE